MTTTCIASSQTIGDYLRWMRARNLSPKTIGTARSILHGLAIATGGGDILNLTHADLFAWQCRRAEQLAARSLRTQLSYVRVFYAWAVEEGYLAADPSARLATPKVPRLLPRPIAETDLAEALDQADQQVRTILMLASYAGLRAAEIANIDWSDVFISGAEPTIRVVGKGSKERIVDLSPDLVRQLRRLGVSRGPVIRRRDGRPGRNTPNRISQIISRYLKGLDIAASCHSGRHRAITQVCRLGDVRLAAEFAGHASVSTTGGYAAVARRDLRPIVVAAGMIQAS